MRRYDVEISTEKFSTHTVFINRIPNRSLGFTISSKRGNIYIKKVDTEPAISSGLKVHDKIISVNQRQIAGLDHVEIVELMITSPSTLRLDYSVWSILEEKGCAKPHPNVESLKRALKKAWNEITLETLIKIVDNFPKRLKACMDAKGGHFE
uniref:PDZ domain-containing protein n=1 Tax=Acrobeloides nanus TaxID=290746 RepID=A0A914CSV2_9BILA